MACGLSWWSTIPVVPASSASSAPSRALARSMSRSRAASRRHQICSRISPKPRGRRRRRRHPPGEGRVQVVVGAHHPRRLGRHVRPASYVAMWSSGPTAATSSPITSRSMSASRLKRRQLLPMSSVRPDAAYASRSRCWSGGDVYTVFRYERVVARLGGEGECLERTAVVRVGVALEGDLVADHPPVHRLDEASREVLDDHIAHGPHDLGTRGGQLGEVLVDGRRRARGHGDHGTRSWRHGRRARVRPCALGDRGGIRRPADRGGDRCGVRDDPRPDRGPILVSVLSLTDNDVSLSPSDTRKHRVENEGAPLMRGRLRFMPPIPRSPRRPRPSPARPPRRDPRGHPAAARRAADARLRAHRRARGAHGRPLAAEPRLRLPDARPARGRGPRAGRDGRRGREEALRADRRRSHVARRAPRGVVRRGRGRDSPAAPTSGSSADRADPAASAAAASCAGWAARSSASCASSAASARRRNRSRRKRSSLVPAPSCTPSSPSHRPTRPTSDATGAGDEAPTDARVLIHRSTGSGPGPRPVLR